MEKTSKRLPAADKENARFKWKITLFDSSVQPFIIGYSKFVGNPEASEPLAVFKSKIIMLHTKGYIDKSTRIDFYDNQTLELLVVLKKETLLGSKQNGICGIDDIAVVDGIGVIALTAAISTAAPLILALTSLLKQHNLHQAGDEAAIAESTQNMVKAPDIAEEGGDYSEDSSSNQRQREDFSGGGSEDESNEGSSEAETMEGPVNRKKIIDVLTKVEAATKAADKGAKTYAASVAPKTKNLPVAQPEEIPEEAKSFFAKMKDSMVEHPAYWIGGTVALVSISGVIYAMNKNSKRKAA